ncbi:DUF4926 domain-containing protein [Phytoactinopolyspora endophytica]|uniref:DUF4926 domain-containing protein n=1 Tax=Phytoactinopolyspora endophytica TaxID=1642495 RepID=UPI001F115139|nr:DUF4926 domain-containing protein [Phytoactinopolyspora endophytica]
MTRDRPDESHDPDKVRRRRLPKFVGAARSGRSDGARRAKDVPRQELGEDTPALTRKRAAARLVVDTIADLAEWINADDRRQDDAREVVDHIRQRLVRILAHAAALDEIADESGPYAVAGTPETDTLAARDLDVYLTDEDLACGLHELDLSFPSGLRARLDSLLDKQDESGMGAQERDEAQGLIDLSELLSVLRLRARRVSQSRDVRTHQEHDIVVLQHDLPQHGLVAGEVGTVVGVYVSGGYDVEFTSAPWRPGDCDAHRPGHQATTESRRGGAGRE